MNKYLIEAGAGAGKTTTLVGGKKNDGDIKGIIECIQDGVKIEEIVAITFTEAATTELETRFKNKLLSLQSDDEIIKERIIEARNNIDKINISTIHSFCNKILSEFTLEAQLPVVKNIIQGEEEDKYFNSLFEKVISETQLPYFLDVYNFSISDIKSSFIDSFKKLRGELFSQKDIHPLIGSESIDKNYKDIENVYNEDLKNYIENCEEFFKKNNMGKVLPEIFSKNYKKIINEKDKKFFNYNDVLFLKNNLITETGNFSNIFARSDVFKKNINLIEYSSEELKKIDKLKNELKKLIADQKNSVFEEINKVITEFKKIIITEWTKLLNELLTKANRIKENDNIFTNDDILYLTLKFLKDVDNKDNTFIKNTIAKKYKYIFIDEFQDTDPVQRDIFKLIYKFATECDDADLTLYYIGDPKQSIYRFRGADLDCYLETKTDVEKTDGIRELSYNYRSSKNILDYFNDVFSLQNYFGEYIKYTPMKLGRRLEDEYYNNNILTGVYKKLYVKPKPKNEEGIKVEDVRIEEADYIADLIYNAVKNNIKINKRIDNKVVSESAKYSDFMIITPTTSPQKFYLNALKNKGISVHLQGRMNYTTQCYKLLDAFFMYFAAQKNINFVKVYLSEVLIPDKEYKDITEEDLKPYVFVFNFIEEYKNKDVYLMLDNISLVLSKICKDGWSEVYKIIDNLKNIKMKTYKDLYENFLLLTEKNYERELKLFKNEDSVNIINLHKSKGLQAKIVILADSMKDKEKSDSVLIGKADGEYHISPYTQKPSVKKPSIFAENEELEEININEEIKLEEEYKRLVYVAATRAEEVLLILSSDSDKQYWSPLLNNKTIEDVDKIENLISDKKINDDNIKENNKQEIIFKEFEYDKSLLNKTTEVLNPSKADTDKINFSEDDNEVLLSSETSKGYTEDFKLVQPLFGTVVHKIMEELVNEYCINKNYPSDMDVLIKSVIYEFVDNETCEKVYQSNLISLKEKVDNFYKNEKLQNSIKNAKSIITELPFKYITEKEGKQVLVNGIMDLVIEKDDNNYEIWDYKTTKNTDNLESEQFEKELQNKYKNQMQIYKDTLKLILKEKGENYKVEDANICAL